MNPAVPTVANLSKKPDDDEKSSSSDGTVEEPTETEKRYAALRNHQIRFADAIDPMAERVYKLRKKDIVFGRGRGFQNHPGNERMRDIIEKFKTQYHSLNRDGKRKLVEAVHAEIVEGGGRFLKKLDGQNVWVVVDLPIALQKVSHTMRCRKSIIRQLDEHGNIPTVLGGPSHEIPGAVPVMPPSALAGMRAPVAFPGMGQAAGIPPGFTLAAGIPPGFTLAAGISQGMAPAAGIPGIPGMNPSAAIPGLATSATGVLPRANPTASVKASIQTLGSSNLYAPPAMGSSDSSLATLETQRMAALHRYRVLSGMAVARQGDIEYYQRLRRDQLLRETKMLQHMGDAALLGGPSTGGAVTSSMMGTPGAGRVQSAPGVQSAAVRIPGGALGVSGAAAVGAPGAAPATSIPSSMLAAQAASAQHTAAMAAASFRSARAAKPMTPAAETIE